MKKDKNKGKKTIAAVGAVVVAGLTPGIIAASAAGTALQAPNATVTAAEVVAIGGNTYDYDELYDMQQRADGPKQAKKKKEQRQQATRYGVPRPQHATYYGVPRPSGTFPSKPSPPPKPDPTIVVVTMPNSETVEMTCLEYLMEYSAQLIAADARGIMITPDSDLSHELGMNEDQLKALKAEIEDCFGVEVSYNRFFLKGQLNTLRLISEYIYKLKTVWYR